MLYAIIGKPGEGKTQYAVSKHFEFDALNRKNFKKNLDILSSNKNILVTSNMFDCFEDFSCFDSDIFFENYFKKHLEYNSLIKSLIDEKSLKLDFLLPVRQIYSDISGLKTELFFNILPPPDDWRDTPEGSIIFYDEIQEREPYEFKGNKYSQDPMIKALSKIRHGDRDIWAITQDANRLEKSLHKLIDRMYFIKRPDSKPKCASVYVFDQWLSNPRAAADSQQDLKKYREYFIFNYKQKYFDAYQSASSHSSMSFRLNKKIVFILLGIIFLFCISVYGFKNVKIFDSFSVAFKQMTGQSTNNSLDDLKNFPSKSLEHSESSNSSNPIDIKDFSTDCIKPEFSKSDICLMWLKKNKPETSFKNSISNNLNSFPDSNISKSFSNDYSSNFSPDNEIVSIIIFDNHCFAYTREFKEIKGISQKDCYSKSNSKNKIL